MIIEQVKEYNARMLAKWNKDVEEWKQDKNTHNIIPQLVFYLFWNDINSQKMLQKDIRYAKKKGDNYIEYYCF